MTSLSPCVSVNLIVAMCAETRGIGFRGELPWTKLKTDLRHFRRLTEGGIVVMGKNTHLSILRATGGQGLAKRLSVVLSSTLPDCDDEFLRIVRSFDELIDFLRGCGYNRPIWIIGGEELYRQVIDASSSNVLRIDTCYVTKVFDDGAFECDTFFPQFMQMNENTGVLLNAYEENGLTVENWKYYVGV